MNGAVLIYPAATETVLRNQTVPSLKLEALLDELELLKKPSQSSRTARLRALLATIRKGEFKTASSLIRLHETLLFLRAYPQTSSLLKQTETILAGFSTLIKELIESDADDLDELAEPEVSGIAGTSFAAVFSYDIVRWLAREFSSHTEIDWDNYSELDRLGSVIQLFVPQLAENAYVDNFYSLSEWLRSVRGRERELVWLMSRLERANAGPGEQAALFDSLRLGVRWNLGDTSATRTKMLLPGRAIFYHDKPLLSRRDVSLTVEIEDKSPLPIRRLSKAKAERIVAMGRATMTVRYRELHGFTFGDPTSLRHAEVGRGVDMYLWGVPPASRFPLIAYHAVFIVKNGVACGYAEALTLFERCEVGLNIYYTFREGESAWIYARVLRLMRQTLGASVFSAEPYQLGFHNKEGLESGAFWFYRKLGFRPVVPALRTLAAREEEKLATKPGYRSSEKILSALATGHMLFEAPSAEAGLWDRFHLRNIGLASAKRIGKEFDGDVQKARSASVNRLERALSVSIGDWNQSEQRAFTELSFVVSLIPDLAQWSEEEKSSLVEIIKSKAGRDEIRYLRLLQKHTRLRTAILNLGSKKPRSHRTTVVTSHR